MKFNKKKVMIFLPLLILIILVTYVRFYPIAHYELQVEGMTAIRNDELAALHAPTIYSTPAYEMPTQILYRAAVDDEGNTYLAYHIFWDGESNPHSGLLPFLNRWLYTGGLKMQKTMFGPGDIEVIEVKLNPDGESVRIKYETAKDYDPKAFSVSHQWVTLDQGEFNEETVFKVISWNHLFDAVDESQVDHSEYIQAEMPLSYFTEEKWEKYEMFKPTNTLIKRNRAHFDYERESAE